MTIAASSSNPKKKKMYKGGLIRNVVLWLLVLSFVPVLAVGLVTYIRMRSLLTNQANTQMQVIVDNYSTELEKYAATRQLTLYGLIEKDNFSLWLNQMIGPDSSMAERQEGQTALTRSMQSILFSDVEPVFDEVFLIDSAGTVLSSTNAERVGKKYDQTPEINQLINTTQTVSLFKSPGLFPYDLVLLSSKAFTHTETGKNLTLVGATAAPLVTDVLNRATENLNEGRAYVFNLSNAVIGLTSSGSLVGIENMHEQMGELSGVAAASGMNKLLQYQSYRGFPVLGYARWMPRINMGLMVEIPETVVYEQMRFMGPFYLLVLFFGLIITAISLSFGTARIVTPIMTLVETVQHFAQGDWTQRAKVNRTDELGLLAQSFNSMADDLSRLYRSLETKVEERNKQLHTAAEMAQVVTSTTSRQEILKRTVILLTEQFEYDYAGVYLLDQSGSSFTMRETGGRISAAEPDVALQTRIRTQSVFGKVITRNQAEVIEENAGEPAAQRPETLLSAAKAEAVIPIAVSGQVIGLLDVQSSQLKSFSSETLPVLQLLADQIANGLQNIRLLESTQVDLQETSLLYRASRQIAQANHWAEIDAILTSTFEQTPYVGMMLNHSGNQLNAASIYHNPNLGEALPRITLTFSRVEAQLERSSYLLLDNINKPSEFYPVLSFFTARGCSQAAFIPIHLAGEMGKVLVIGAAAETPLTDTGLQPYVSLSEVLANTQERLNVLADLEHNLAELKTVAVVSQAISVEVNLQKVFSLLHEQIIQTIGGSLGFFVGLYNKDTNMIDIPYIVEHGERIQVDAMELGEGLTSILIQKREPMLLSHNAIQQAALLGAKIVGAPARSWVGVPLIIGNEVIGAMVAEDTETDGRFTERDLRLFSTLAPQVAVAIRNAQLLSEMEKALQAYDQERFLLNNLLENIPDQVYFKDTESKYIRASRSLTAARGLVSPEDIIGKLEPDLQPGEQAEQVLKEEQQLMTTRQAQIGSVEKSGEEENTSWSLISRLPMVNQHGDVVGLLGISRDITGLKQAEENAQTSAQQLLTAAEIARDTSGTLNVNELLSKAVNLVRDRFGFYHASIFLLDPLNEYAVLRESTGEAGAQLKLAGHRLAVGSQSIVGQTTARGRALVVNDVKADPNYYPNPLLPMTRSELAIPLMVGERVVGALDVQSTRANAFLTENINILQILADQMAVAIVTADLFAQSHENISKHRLLHQITTAAAACTNVQDALATTVQALTASLGSDRVAIYLRGNDDTLMVRASAGYSSLDLSQVKIQLGVGAVGQCAAEKQPVLIKDTRGDSRYRALDRTARSQLCVPILYSSKAVGVLAIESDTVAAYDENDQEILASLGNNLGAILSNAQLVEQVVRQVEQQKMLFEITNKIRRSTDIEAILQTSTREICKAVRAQRAHIELRPVGEMNPAAAIDSGSNGSNGRHPTQEPGQ